MSKAFTIVWLIVTFLLAGAAGFYTYIKDANAACVFLCRDANDNATFSGDVTVSGDLAVTGTTEITGAVSSVLLAPVTFANLGTPDDGTLSYCSDCTIASPCASGGTGALAKRLNSTWVCN